MYLEESSYECQIKHLPPSSSKFRSDMFENLLTLKSYTLDSEIKWIKHRKRKGFQLTYSVYSFSQPGITFN